METFQNTLKTIWIMCSNPPMYTLLRIPLPSKAKAHFVLEWKYLSQKRSFCENKNLEGCLYNGFDTSGMKTTLIFFIILSNYYYNMLGIRYHRIEKRSFLRSNF